MFKPSRAIFFAAKGPEKASEAPKKKTEVSQEVIDKRLEKGVAFKGDIMDAIDRLGKEAYKENADKAKLFAEEKKAAMNKFLDSLKIGFPDQIAAKPYNGNAQKFFENTLKQDGCARVGTVKEDNTEYFRFYKKDGKEMELTTVRASEGVAIDKPEPEKKPAEKPEDKKKKEAAPAAPETVEGAAADIEMFRKRYPKKAEQIKAGPNIYGEGSRAEIPRTLDLPVYGEDGGKQRISYETLGDYSRGIAKITKPYLIIAPNEQGILTKYVYIVADVNGSMKKGHYEGWVELSRLRNINQVKPEEKVAMAVSEEKAAEEEKKEAESKKAQEARKPYIDADGIVHLKGWKETKEIKLQTLFPNAEKGDQVVVRSKLEKWTRTATFDGSDWVDGKGKHVPIFNGDRVTLVSEIDYEKKVPAIPALGVGESVIEATPRKLSKEQMADATAGKLKWNDIAKGLMEEFPQIGETGIKRAEYAKILAKYSTETGYYWVILPAKVEPTAEEAAAKEIAEGKKEAKRKTEKGQVEIRKRADAVYDQYEAILLGDKKMLIKSKDLAKLVDSPSAWKEAWDKNYPLNSKLIMDAFKHPPFNSVPENMIRDGVREMMHVSVGQNRWDFSDLFDYFNKNGEFYKNLDGEPGSFGDFKKEWRLIKKTLPEKIDANKKKGKAINSGFSSTEQKAWKMWRDGMLDDVMHGAALIFDALAHCIRSEAEKVEYVKVKPTLGEAEMSPQDSAISKTYRTYIYEDRDLTTPDAIDPYINDEKKWNDLWDKDKGNISILKKALMRPPYNRVSLGAHKTRIREAMHDSLSKNDVNMSDLLKYLNPEGEIYKNRKGKPGRYSDFKEEFTAEQIGDKVRKGKSLTAAEQKYYDKQPNKAALGDRYAELTQLWVSSAYVFDAIGKLSPTASPSESIAEGEKPSAYLESIFPPTDTGSVNGVSQDYYDTYQEGGQRIAGGGLFTGGLFKYDFRDRAKGISDLDLVTSNATAYRIVLDQCTEPDGKLNKKKLEARLNELLTLGIASLLSEPDSAEKTKALKALGLSKEDAERTDAVPYAAKKLAISFEKGSLSGAQKDLVRLGFLLETAARPGVVKEVSEGPVEWSTDPKVRILQKQALQLGAKPSDLPKIEEEMRNQIIAFFHLKVGKNFSGIDEAGVTIPIKIAGKGKNNLYLAISPAYNFADGKFVLRAGIGGSVEVAKGVSLLAGVGYGTDKTFHAGIGVKFEIPVDKDTVWEPSLTIGGMISTSNLADLDVIVGGALVWERNLGKQKEADLQEQLEKAGFAKVEKAKDVHEKAELLRHLPGPNGMVIAQIDASLDLSDEQLVNLYEQHIRKKMETSVSQAGLSEHKFLGFLPPVTMAGFGIGVRLKGGVAVIPGVAFGIALGSELLLFQRPTSSSEHLAAAGEESMEKQAEAAILAKQKFIAEAKKAGYSKITFESSPLVGDIESGLKPVKTETAKVASSTTEKPDEAEMDKQFQEFAADLLKHGLKLEKVDKMYKLTVLNVGNLQVYVDPQMNARTGVYLKDGAIMIAANKNPKLVIKRSDMYYPRPKEGNLKHTIVTISDQDFRTQKAIMEESDFYLDSRTKDQTGTERTPLTHNIVSPFITPKQFNLRPWVKGEKMYFDTLETTTSDMLAYRAQAEKEAGYAKLGDKLGENIGTANLEAVDAAKIHTLAVEFMKKHPALYRQYTTHQLSSEPDLQKLNAQIKKDYPELTEDEITYMKEELFNLSMSEAEKKLEGLPEEKKKQKRKELMLSKLEWEKNAIYVPFFKKYLTKENNPNGYSAEEVAEAFVAPMRTMILENPEQVPVGAGLDIAVGSQKVVGRRGLIVGNPETVKDHRMFIAKDYSTALVSGKPPIDRTIALVLRESQRPLEKLKEDEFLGSPWAIKLMLLGANKGRPVMLKVLGEEAYKKLTECYATKPPKVAEGAENYVKQLRQVAMLLNDAQTGKNAAKILVDGKEYMALVVNGVIIGVRTGSMKSGVYERCLNAANMYDDTIVSVDTTEKFVLVNGFRSYNSAASQSLSSSQGVSTFNVGLGAWTEFAPSGGPPSGPPKGEPGKGGKVEVSGGNQEGGGEQVTTPNTTVGGTPAPAPGGTPPAPPTSGTPTPESAP